MERKDYNNIVKSMQLSNHWYYAEEELGAEIRYGLFEPTSELITELMQYEGYFYLDELAKSCEYTKNTNLLYLLTEFFLAKWKYNITNIVDDFNHKDELEDCLYSSLQTMYRLSKAGEITWDDPRIGRVIGDFKENANIEKCHAVLNALLMRIGYNIELSPDAVDFIEDEEKRINEIQRISNEYKDKYVTSYNDLYIPITFIVNALKEGMISIQANGTIKSPFIDEESDFKFDPEVVFMLDEDAQACIIKEGIDKGKIITMGGLDFLKSTQPNVKKL